jgi:tetratricopeptide (TPR) repeat protein
LQNSGAFTEAAAAYKEISAHTVTLNLAANLGLCLSEDGEFEEAEHWLLIAARHRPANAELRRLLANLYTQMGKLDPAELEYRTALAFQADNGAARLGLAGLLLSQGRFAEGWPLMEARIELNPEVVPPIRVSFPEWRGEPLAGKSILVWYEQGLGDQIQFSRFAQTLKARGAAHVALGCRPPLVDLLKTAPAVDEVVTAPRGEVVSIQRYDFWSRYFSLPHRLGTTLETLPDRPYLAAPEDRRARWRGFAGVGLAWRASPTGFNARNKTVPDALARRLLDLGAKSLHPEDTGVADFADTAAIVEQLDLVISIDTSVAHLAGAMGKPCWTLLPRLHSDWRWLRDRSDSPWYPTMRLYRQATPFDWAPVIDRLERDLKAWLAARG